MSLYEALHIPNSPFILQQQMVNGNGSRFYRALEILSSQHIISFIYRSYHLPMPDQSPSTLTVLNSNFLQLGRSGGRPQRTVCPSRLPANCETHCVSGDRTHNLPIVRPTRSLPVFCATETTARTRTGPYRGGATIVI